MNKFNHHRLPHSESKLNHSSQGFDFYVEIIYLLQIYTYLSAMYVNHNINT